MEEAKSNIQQVIHEIEEITQCLYQQKLQEGYSLLDSTLGHIIDVIDSIFVYRINQEIVFDENKMLDNLKSAMVAMENKDNVLLADILTYEVSEQLKEIEISIVD